MTIIAPDPMAPVPAISSINGLVQCAADVLDYRERCGDLIWPPICKEDEACFTEDGCRYDCIKKPSNVFEQCGADVPDLRERCGDNVDPPVCGEDQACVTSDGCKYNCIPKSQCNKNLFNSLMENGKLLCNCAVEPTYKYSWACEFNDNQHGFASVPQMNKVYEFDYRNITVLEGSRYEEFQRLLRERKDFVNFFQTSPCKGVTNANEKSVTFDNLFNNPQCMPACETITKNGTLYKQCSAIVGYDDLNVPIGGQFSLPAVLQRGKSWMFTCTRSLYGGAEATGAVNDVTEDLVSVQAPIDTKFNLDIHCCDPEDEECFDDCTNNPVFQIGPNAELDEARFYVSMDFEYGNLAITERGFLHVESCTFEEFDKNDTLIFGPLEVLHDGCPTKFSGISFLENMRPRTVEGSHEEIMDMKPFRIKNDAYYFKLTCEMLNCPWDAVNNDLCRVKDQCYLEDRYEPFYSYSRTMWDRRTQSRSSGPVNGQTVTKSLRHPCSEVEKTGDKYCVGNEERDCWTVDLCKARPRMDSGSSVSLASLTAVALTLML